MSAGKATLGVDHVMVLGQELVPPEGYVADALIAATYSLDPVMALALPISLVRHGRFAGEVVESSDPYAVMEAIRRFAPRYRVFHDAAGLLTVPRAQRRMLNLLGEVIVPVSVPRAAASAPRPTFHPKFVLVRFTAPYTGKADVIRLICMSRNLTGAAALDVCCVIDAGVGAKAVGDASNQRLAEALQRLPAWSSKQDAKTETRELVESLADSARRASWRAPEGFRAVRIWPLGFGDSEDDPTRPQPGDTRVLVMSPFLDNRRVRSLAGGRTQNVLISSADALAAIPADTRDLFDVKTLDEARVPGDGLHAKLYVVEGGSSRRWVVGSANATNAAVTRNAELVLELEAGRSDMGISDLLDYERGIGSILLDYVAPGEEIAPPPRHTRAEELLGELAYRTLTAHIKPDEEHTHRLEIELDRPFELDRAKATVALADERWEPLDPTAAPAAVLRRVARKDIAPFIRVNVEADGESHQRLMVLQLEGIDLRHLADEAIADLIREDGTLDPLEYLRRMLMGEEIGPLGLSFEEDGHESSEDLDDGEGVTSPPAPAARAMPPMLEALLAALEGRDGYGRGSELLNEVASVVESFRDELPADFIELWKVIGVTREAQR